MFNRYWRDYPWSFQFLQFIILILVFASVCIFGIIPILVRVTGLPLEHIDASTPSSLVRAAFLYQFVSAVGIFLLPSLLFGYFTHPRPLQYLGLRAPGKPVQAVLVVLIILGAMPVMIAISNWVSIIELKGSLKQMEDENETMMKGFMNMRAFGDFLLAFITLAILPAVSEELFFRGVMFKMAAKRGRNVFFSILLSATIFALFHFNVYGFLSILLAGILLGCIYYLTGSLWLSMLAHMINNGLQIVLVYCLKDSAMAKAAMEANVIPWYLPAGGLLLFGISFYLLWVNRTPLPRNWTDDFDADELPMLEEGQGYEE